MFDDGAFLLLKFRKQFNVITMACKGQKNIAVVGHLVWDRIVKPDGGVTEAMGGIAYSLTALGAIAPQGCRICPVCNIGYDMRLKVKETFGRYPNIDLSLIRLIKRQNKIHQLIYSGNNYRRELNFGAMPDIRLSLLAGLNSCDIVWLNYIGGNEFRPYYIRLLKARYKPLIYMDYHSLALGEKIIDKEKLITERYFRYNTHWRDYVALADIVQMNSAELRSIYSGARDDDIDSIIAAALKVYAAGPKIVIITREEKELVVVSGRRKEPDINLLKVMPAKVVDPTGCGDSLGAGFIASYIQDGDLLKACHNGLALARKKAGFSGLDGFSKLRCR